MADDWLLGIEIGGTKLQLGIGRRNTGLEAMERRRVDPSRGAAGILEQIREMTQALVHRAVPQGDRIGSVGVGFGGPVNTLEGKTETSYQVAGWDGFPLADWIRSNLGVPSVFVHNDADTAGLAEARLGAGAGCSPLIYLTIGSGIGGALILDGQIYRGAGLGAMEIGHFHVPDPATGYSTTRDLQSMASGWGIARQAWAHAASIGSWVVLEKAQGDAERITAEDVVRAAAAGDHDAQVILGHAHQALAFALRQAIALIAPRRIILGGGVSLIGEDHWFNPIRKLVDEAVFAPFRGSYDIVPAALGEAVVVHGALALAADTHRDCV